MDETMESIDQIEYRFAQRTDDLQESLEGCVTVLTKIEKRQEEVGAIFEGGTLRWRFQV